MHSSVIIYTKDNCTHCVQAKNILTVHDKQYKEINIGRDIRREDFVSLFPSVRTVPHIIINGEEIGGTDKFTEWLNTAAGRSFLAE